MESIALSNRRRSTLRQRLEQWFDGWIATLEFDVLLDAYTVPAWVITTVAVVVVLALLSWLGGTYISVRFVPSLIAWLPTLVVGLAISFIAVRRHPPVRLIWTLVLVESSLMQAFFAFLVFESGSHSVFVFGPLLVFVAAYQGYMNRVTLRHSFGTLGTVAAIVGAYVIEPSTSAAIKLIPLGVASVAFGILLGTLSLKRYQRRRAEQQLRNAVLAQMDAERQKAFDDARETIVETSARNHDVNNLLMMTGMLAEDLGEEIHACRTGEGAWDEVDSLLGELTGNLEEVRRRVVEAKEAFRVKRSQLEGVGVDAAVVAERILSQLSRRFPRVRFLRTGLSGNDGIRPVVAVYQGETVLARILENLLINACEGRDGSGASEIECRMSIEGGGNAIAIDVLDDGPGFSDQILRTASTSMQTTKPRGTGLGLYTVGRLVRASGGSLVLSHRSGGGASARVTLPIAVETKDQPA